VAAYVISHGDDPDTRRVGARYGAIERNQFTDPVTVHYSVSGNSEVFLKSPASGVVTGSTCATGAPIASGTSPFSLDEKPIIALSTNVPIWRDLVVGDAGSDVAALQTELKRLGFSLTADGELGAATTGAFSKLHHSLNLTGEPALSRSALLWLPVPTATVKTCNALLGDTIQAGDTVATLIAGTRSIRVSDIPANMVAGRRVLVVENQRLLVDQDGLAANIPPSVRLTAASASPSNDSGGNATEATATLELADAIEVVGLPPSSIYSLENSSGCVVSKSGPLRVEVIASQLGQTFVTFPDAAIPESVRLDRRSGPECR
jgi:peptidoglycan hydrolase-like protein with peptidoglycan-binding domain